MALYDVREEMAAVAANFTHGTYTLDATRVKLGYHPFATTDEFLQELKDDGPFMLIRGGGAATIKPHTAQSEYSIAATLWFGLEREAD